LVEEHEKLYLSDLGSRNGTYLNGKRLRAGSVALKPGDRIRLGVAVELVLLEVNAGDVPNLRVDSGDEQSTITNARRPELAPPRVGAALVTGEQENTNTGIGG
jgi:pSer/pThr/pTyr-binding forkhead associated (FHA) protein